MNLVTFFLQSSVVSFSLLAAIFWMFSAKPPGWVLPAERRTYPAKSNARAASCAAVAAFAQAFSFLLEHPLPPTECWFHTSC
jgi:hypothetical protein